MTPAVELCRSCGATPREGVRFYDSCGSPMMAAVDTAMYKQVTVLFADVERSMELAAAVDVERLREIMTELVERSATVVQRYGGTLEYTGDGVMALFGAPVALEDDAFRGCLAALAIQEQANRLAAEVARRDGVALRLRVGLNSGRVIAGELASGALGYAATGEVVGFAQRMESAAPPGAVTLSESTARLVEHTVMLAEPEWVRKAARRTNRHRAGRSTPSPSTARRVAEFRCRRRGVSATKWYRAGQAKVQWSATEFAIPHGSDDAPRGAKAPTPVVSFAGTSAAGDLMEHVGRIKVLRAAVLHAPAIEAMVGEVRMTLEGVRVKRITLNVELVEARDLEARAARMRGVR